MRFVGRGKSTRASLLHRALLAVIALAALAVALGACGSGSDDDGGSGDQGGVVEITCGVYCVPQAVNAGTRVTADVMKQFNEKYRGRYRMRAINDPNMRGSNERPTYYQRLALAGDLPDVFEAVPAEGILLGRTGRLMDFGPYLKDDSGWGSTFHEGLLDPGTDEAGHNWSIPVSRDVVGIYWNREIFREAGVSEFPRTWDEFRVACEKITAIGKTCIGMDGLWTTLLMWANLIGTQPGGRDFMLTGIKSDDFSTFPEVVRATETLKQWHVEGFTNRDAYSGDYQNAANAFIRGQAAMIANGPWMVVSDITTKNAIKGLYDIVGYEFSPGWTADGRGVVVSSEFAFSSAAQDKRKQEAVVAFLKLYEESANSYALVKGPGFYPAVKWEPTAAQRKTLEPLALEANLRSVELPSTYPHPLVGAPASINTVFPNLWPAYVRGQMSTEEFLSKFASDLQSKTGS